jgi:hypothetical protein
MEGSFRNVVLLCEECGERTVLGGPLSVWRSGSTSFECECGAQLTLSDQLEPLEADEPAETRAGALYRKLGVSSRAAAAREALERDLI